LPAVIIVAGSKGKGSTAHLIASILGAAGLRTGLYTSPHIDRWNERIAAEGQDILDEEAAALIERYGADMLRAGSDGERATYFEVMTALAFLHFVNHALDVVVLEVGLGGRFDAVNVCDARVAVITQLGLEHQSVLGETIGQIALEKAGVMRTGQFVILEHQPIAATAALWAEADRVGALRVDAGLWEISEGSVGQDFQEFILTRAGQSLGPLRLRLLGRHQLRNARLAVMAALAYSDKTGNIIPDEAIARGLVGLRMPVRMEFMPGHPDLLLDGAHNTESAAALADAVQRHFPNRKIRLVVGMMRDKNPQKFMEEMKKLNPVEVIAVGVESDRAWSERELAEQWSGLDAPVRLAHRWQDAQELLKKSASEAGLVLVTGSLYLAGEARRHRMRGAA
jgi:dihydrofolate synthase/folylpolyglutamate synthase